MNRTLYFDCFSGISGDMTVGALYDLGVEPERLEAGLRKLSLGETQIRFERQSRQGIPNASGAGHVVPPRPTFLAPSP